MAISKKWAGWLGAVALGVMLWGCATTGGGDWGGLPPIPEGRGRLLLETGGIPEVNFYVFDQETDEEVYSDTPRLAGTSPAGFERGGVLLPQFVDLPAGHYTVVVNTDIEDDVELPDVQVVMGEMRYAQLPIGRFQVLFSDAEGRRLQAPFLIFDYNMRNVLGRGMTSTEIRYFITPVGNYKVRIENAPSGLDEIRPVQVTFGRTQNITIGVPAPATPEVPGEGSAE